MSDVYHEHLLERYKEPSCKGHLENSTHECAMVNSSCGDEVTVELVVDDSGKITDAAWSGNGCSLSQVAADIICEKTSEEGFTVSKALTIELSDVESWLELPQVSPGRVKCLSLGLMAVKRALSETENKK